MRFPFRIFTILLFLLFLGAGRADASFISMVTDHRVESKEDGVVTRMKVTNKGDETAYNVQVSAELEGEIKKGPLQDELKVNESLEVVLEFPLKFEKAGKYPVIVSVDYTDLNRYPFTAISIGEADYKERLLGRVAGEINAKPFSKSGKISVTVKNLEKKEYQFNLRLVLPREFTVDRETDSITVLPGEEGSLKYTIKNISALQNSQYQIYVLVSYEDGPKHYMHPLAYTVEIVPFQSFIGQYSEIFLIIAGGLLIIAVTIHLLKRSRRTSLP